jgi:hypothetical protein
MSSQFESFGIWGSGRLRELQGVMPSNTLRREESAGRVRGDGVPVGAGVMPGAQAVIANSIPVQSIK